MEGRIFPFATAAERFRLIETPAVTVYIPQGKGEHLLARLRAGEVSKLCSVNWGNMVFRFTRII